jgi:hypothetical protein
VPYLYHISKVENLELIKENGLVPKILRKTTGADGVTKETRRNKESKDIWTAFKAHLKYFVNEGYPFQDLLEFQTDSHFIDSLHWRQNHGMVLEIEFQFGIDQMRFGSTSLASTDASVFRTECLAHFGNALKGNPIEQTKVDKIKAHNVVSQELKKIEKLNQSDTSKYQNHFLFKLAVKIRQTIEDSEEQITSERVYFLTEKGVKEHFEKYVKLLRTTIDRVFLLRVKFEDVPKPKLDHAQEDAATTKTPIQADKLYFRYPVLSYQQVKEPDIYKDDAAGWVPLTEAAISVASSSASSGISIASSSAPSEIAAASSSAPSHTHVASSSTPYNEGHL